MFVIFAIIFVKKNYNSKTMTYIVVTIVYTIVMAYKTEILEKIHIIT